MYDFTLTREIVHSFLMRPESLRACRMTNELHIHYMKLALQLAEQGRFTVSPNPMVGCVIVKEQSIVGRGFHLRAGQPHAEVYALEEAGEHTNGATVYVTLEPCVHHGRTPPCVEALIRAGVKEVWIACLDPNPLVSGKGVAALRSAGIHVEVGLCESEAIELNKIFFHYITHQRPYVMCKWAISADGKTMTHAEDARQISSLHADQHTHFLRRSLDAILIGANTLRVDNPALTARQIPDNTLAPEQPLRVVLSRSGKLPVTSQMLAADYVGKTLIVTTSLHSTIEPTTNIELLILPANQNGNINLTDLLTELAKRQITSLLVEGGMQVHHQFISENLVNEYSIYMAPVIIGDLNKKIKLSHVNIQSLGDDVHLTAKKEAKHYV
jgi:diaminohydroxyphosphoribosylaminopyrimidine deaminase/5-amino-6-(5-phosphoribosylamino)uracil reductase